MNTMELTYQDVEKLYPFIVNAFMSYYKVSRRFRDDLYSVALLSFPVAYQTYTEDRGEFSYWARYKAWFSMMVEMNKWQKNITGENATEENIPNNEPGIMERLLTEVGEDATTVIKILCDHAPDRLSNNPNKIEKHKSTIVQSLYRLGWTASRICESFAEIREVVING